MVTGKSSGRGGYGIPHVWACADCEHKRNERRHSCNVRTCTCALNGRSYGSVKSCPHKEAAR